MKTLNEFVQLFAELFDETEVSVFSPETVFRDLDEWSSLIGLSVIAMVDEEFGVALKAVDFRDAATIKDLYDIVINKL
ncbi:MAG: acyl carrier protein [Bacteroidales bacterium]|nr:acyl carrier protein [Bacteroidales bacterium]